MYVVEGEKDVHALEALGVVATTSPMGSGNFAKVDVTPLTGAHVVVVPDQDDAGAVYLRDIVAALQGVAATVKAVRPKVGKDAADHVAAGFGLDELVADAVPQVGRRARITWADQIKIRPVVWTWTDKGEGRIPAGTLCVAAGREGTGKSTFGIWLAAQITRGTLPGNLYGTPRRVLYVAIEDSWEHTLAPRLKAAGADLSMVGRFDVIEDTDEQVTLSLPADNELLEASIREHDVALVVPDPLMSVISERIDTHRTRDVRMALDPLAGIANRTGCLLLGIPHFNKNAGTDPSLLITGSGAFKDVPRSVLGFVRDADAADGSRVMTQTKNNLGRDDLPSLRYLLERVEIATDEDRRRHTAVLAGRVRPHRPGHPAGLPHLPRGPRRTRARRALAPGVPDRAGRPGPRHRRQEGRGRGRAQLEPPQECQAQGGCRLPQDRHGGGWVWALKERDTSPEGSAKGSKGAGTQEPPPSVPSVLPSADTPSHPTDPPSGTAPSQSETQPGDGPGQEISLCSTAAMCFDLEPAGTGAADRPLKPPCQPKAP